MWIGHRYMRYNYMDVISKQLCTRGKYKCERPSRWNTESERFTLGRTSSILISAHRWSLLNILFKLQLVGKVEKGYANETLSSLIKHTRCGFKNVVDKRRNANWEQKALHTLVVKTRSRIAWHVSTVHSLHPCLSVRASRARQKQGHK